MQILILNVNVNVNVNSSSNSLNNNFSDEYHIKFNNDSIIIEKNGNVIRSGNNFVYEINESGYC